MNQANQNELDGNPNNGLNPEEFCEEGAPGPGTYNVAETVSFFNPEGVAGNKSFSCLTNMGSFSFGGTARRFPHQEPSKPDTPRTQARKQEQIERGVIKPGAGGEGAKDAEYNLEGLLI